MTDSEDDFKDDDGEFGNVEREFYTSLMPQPKSNVAVLNALAAEFGLIPRGEWITEQMREFAGAIVDRCCRNAYKAVELEESPREYVERAMLPEPLEEFRQADSCSRSRSRVAVLNALAAEAGLIEHGEWITEEMRRYAGAIIKRCAWYARLALPVDESPSECIHRAMQPESMEEARLTMAKYWRELDAEFRDAEGG